MPTRLYINWPLLSSLTASPTVFLFFAAPGTHHFQLETFALTVPSTQDALPQIFAKLPACHCTLNFKVPLFRDGLPDYLSSLSSLYHITLYHMLSGTHHSLKWSTWFTSAFSFSPCIETKFLRAGTMWLWMSLLVQHHAQCRHPRNAWWVNKVHHLYHVHLDFVDLQGISHYLEREAKASKTSS